MTLVVLAAGMGSRFGGPKQTNPLGPTGEILCDYSLYDAKLAGFTHVVFVIKHEMKEAFREVAGRRAEKDFDVSYVFQEKPEGRQKPYGTGHALLCAAQAVGEPFAVINADDFYGRDGYFLLADFLKVASGTAYCLAGYALSNTLSENGGVSRGVCEVGEGGLLLSVKEHTGIKTMGKKITGLYGGEEHLLAPGTPVSLNLWGFTPEIFDSLQKGFDAFLPHAGTEAEFYLPAAVDQMIKNRQCTVTVLPSEGRWFGVTYREDASTVKAELLKLHRQGEYPALR